jgi:hypothetical protein
MLKNQRTHSPKTIENHFSNTLYVVDMEELENAPLYWWPLQILAYGLYSM